MDSAMMCKEESITHMGDEISGQAPSWFLKVKYETPTVLFLSLSPIT